MADDDIRVHLTSDDIASARDAWLEAIAECHPVERVAERYRMWHRLSGIQARQTLDDSTSRSAVAQAEGGSRA